MSLLLLTLVAFVLIGFVGDRVLLRNGLVAATVVLLTATMFLTGRV
ncbi:MAG TPA: hypothetical protein VJB57_17440 [Dehalococcoidia bacterium]|nr:hypothetical protein [Dehalococcoidia bacterium]